MSNLNISGMLKHGSLDFPFPSKKGTLEAVNASSYNTNTAVSGNYIGEYSGYVEYSNGLKICWGSYGSSDFSVKDVTFPNSGFSTLPSVVFSGYWESGTRELITRNLKTTGVRLFANGNVRSFMWIAVGKK